MWISTHTDFNAAEWDEIFWFTVARKGHEYGVNTYIMTCLSRSPRQIVAFEVDKSVKAKVIQLMIDRNPSFANNYSDGAKSYLDVDFGGRHIRTFGYDKSNTHLTEGSNADIRHYIAGLQRTSRCFFRKMESLKAVLWLFTTVEKILTNEKYVGDLYLRKTFKASITSKRIKNEKQRDMIHVENNHLPIIDREVWNQVQAEMNDRKRTNQVSESGGKYTSKFPFSSKTECLCGSKLRRHAQWNKGTKTPIWVCIKHQKDRTACAQMPIKETILEQAFVGALEQAAENREQMVADIKAQLEATIAGTAHLNMDDLQGKLEARQQELLDHNKAVRGGKVSPENVERGLALMDEIGTLRESVDIAEKAAEAACLLEYRLKMIDTALVMSFATFNADLFKMLIEKVIMIDKNTLRFIFKGGHEITQKI